VRVFSHKKAQKAQNDFLTHVNLSGAFLRVTFKPVTETRFSAKHGARGAGSTRPDSEL
jgi:hypothetical protein